MFLIVENVRCLAGRHKLPIRPLTILTGENSSGKSTALSCLAAVCDPEGFPFAPGFNKAPFNLGNFDTIATFKGGRAGRAKSFTIGYDTEISDGVTAPQVESTFRSREGQVSLAEVAIRSGADHATIALQEEERGYVGTIKAVLHGSEQSIGFQVPRRLGAENVIRLQNLLLGVSDVTTQEEFKVRVDFLNGLTRLGFQMFPAVATSLAPIRTKPERTYGQLAEFYAPGGDHIPFIIERLAREQDLNPDWKQLVTTLQQFGQESGLYRTLDVRLLGNKVGDPFQILVDVGGPPVNIIDVGYGVSQSLPVVVQSVLGAPRTMLLLQQPEVHLHPRAQAALGNLFARLVAGSNAQLVVETHSDYVIDRVRQQVASGTLDAAKVMILYFERAAMETTVSELTLDSNGNIRGAPPSYRQFFLAEEVALLGRARSHR